MIKRNEKLEILVRIAKIRAEHALADVARARRHVETTQDQVAAIKAHRGRLQEAVSDPSQAALMARQAERLRRLQSESLSKLAQETADLEAAKAMARPELGRQQVLETLLNSWARSRAKYPD